MATPKKTKPRGARPTKSTLEAAMPRFGSASEFTSAYPPPPSLTVVGIGASAGGLESITRFLRRLPRRTGLAFVFVQDLPSARATELPEILSRVTDMRVVEGEHRARVLPDHLHWIPPNTSVSLSEGMLWLEPRPPRGSHMPVDAFFRSLATDRRERAIGIVLSGSGSDGALGLQALKAEGGVTLVESEISARFDEMPRAARSTGFADFVLSPEEIADEVGRIAAHLEDREDADFPASEGSEDLARIFALLQRSQRVDFALYRHTTIKRRILRRMMLRSITSLHEYARYLAAEPAELDALFQDVLIKVTHFFRDPPVFEVLKSKVIPELFRNRPSDSPIRIWVPGCSTGEEAFSIAISLLEVQAEERFSAPIHVFATDVSDVAIEKARAGVYIENIALDVSPERLRRFFVKGDKTYQVSRVVRDMCVFARQDVIRDPPFSKLDLISCRNVLIYFHAAVQKQIVPMFHYALRPGGFLVLGTSETAGGAPDLFSTVDKRSRVYRRTRTLAPPARIELDSPELRPGLPSSPPPRHSSSPPPRHSSMLPPRHPSMPTQHASMPTHSSTPTRHSSILPAAEPATIPARPATGAEIQKEADKIVLSRYAPPGAVINASLDIVQFRGHTGPYFEPAPGEASLNILTMARGGMAVDLRAAIHRAKASGAAVRAEGVEVRSGESTREIAIEVVPLGGAGREEDDEKSAYLLVLFEEAGQTPSSSGGEARKVAAENAYMKKIGAVEAELAATKEYLQAIIEEQEATNDELQSANEEILSSNDELRSINEELETAREDLYSTNEELTVLNEELGQRNLELSLANSDLENLFVSVNIPIIMLSRDRRIRRFTPTTTRVLNIIPGDIGRSIGDIRPKVDAPDLEHIIADVIDTMNVRERDVQDREGRWYSMRVRPYRTSDHKIDGAVVVFVDLDPLKRDGIASRSPT